SCSPLLVQGFSWSPTLMRSGVQERPRRRIGGRNIWRTKPQKLLLSSPLAGFLLVSYPHALRDRRRVSIIEQRPPCRLPRRAWHAGAGHGSQEIRSSGETSQKDRRKEYLAYETQKLLLSSPRAGFLLVSYPHVLRDRRRVSISE